MGLLNRPCFLGRIGHATNGLKAKSWLEFVLNPTTLTDAYGNVAEALSGLGKRNVLDYAGVLQSVPATEHRMAGGRGVENLPHNVSVTGTTVLGGDTTGEFTLSNFNGANSNRLNTVITGAVAGKSYGCSIDIKATTPADVGKGVIVRLVDSGGASPTPLLHTLTADYVRVQVNSDPAFTGTIEYVWIYGASTNGASGCTCNRIMMFDATGTAASYVPEYISVAEGHRIFDTTSGNTVLNNIVTEGVGSPITPYHYVDGAKVYTPIPDLKQSTAYVVGDVVNVNGQELECVKAGTTGATVPLDSAMPTVGASPDLITNGSFATNLNSWAYDPTYWEWVNGHVSRIATGVQKHINQTVTTVVGKSYLIEANILAFDLAPRWSLDSSYAGGIASTGTQLFGFVATSTSHDVGFGTNNSTLEFDNVSVKEALVDGTAVFISKGAYKRDFGVLVEDAGTNVIAVGQHNNLTTWTGPAQTTFDQIGVDGTANSASLATDSSTTMYGSTTSSIITITNGTATHCITFVVKKDTDTSRSVLCRAGLSGGTAVLANATVNTASGEYAVTSAYTTPTGATNQAKLVGDWWYVSVPITNNASGNTSIYAQIYPAVGVAALTSWGVSTTGSCIIGWVQIELNTAFASSPMAGGTTRTTEMGAIKWASDGTLSSGDLTRIIDWCPQFASGDLPAANRAIATFNNSNVTILRQHVSNINAVSSYDGLNNTIPIMPAWSKGDCIRLVVRADLTNSLLYFDYRNISNGDSFTHPTAVAYDGAFTDTGFYQYLKAGGGNNSIIRNDLGYNRFMETTELEALYG